jgi:hypothetical protein
MPARTTAPLALGGPAQPTTRDRERRRSVPVVLGMRESGDADADAA